MLNKYYIAIAIIAFGVVFSLDTFGQKEIVVWNSAKAIRSPRDVASGQASNRIASPRTISSLIDTSTGEVVWADEVKSAKIESNATRNRSYRSGSSAFSGSDEELSALINWARNPRPSSSLIDTSTGEVVWLRSRIR